MNLIEKVAYLKGLSEGLAVDENSAEGKLFAKIIEVLDDIACDIEEVYDVQDEIQAEIDEIDEDLAEVEEFLFGEDEEEEDFDSLRSRLLWWRVSCWLSSLRKLPISLPRPELQRAVVSHAAACLR